MNSAELVWQIVFVAFLFLGGGFGIFNYTIDRGYPVEVAQTMAVNALIVREIFYLLFIRNLYGTSLILKAIAGTKMVWLSIFVLTAAQFAFTYIPFMQSVFKTQSVPFTDGLIIVAIGVVTLATTELFKQIRLLLKGEHHEPVGY